jgi:hypothetical protein
MAHFIFWYGFLRIFVDFFRVYPVTLFGLPPGQEFNILMSLAGGLMFIMFSRRKKSEMEIRGGLVSLPPATRGALWFRRVVLVALMLFSLTLPSDWTQDIPARYGKRHPGLHYSMLYPPD